MEIILNGAGYFVLTNEESKVMAVIQARNNSNVINNIEQAIKDDLGCESVSIKDVVVIDPWDIVIKAHIIEDGVRETFKRVFNLMAVHVY